MKRVLAVLVSGSILLALPVAAYADCEQQEQNCNTQRSIDHNLCTNTFQEGVATQCGAAAAACLAAIAAGGPAVGSVACSLALILCLIRAGVLNERAEICYDQADLDFEICVQNIGANCDPLMY